MFDNMFEDIGNKIKKLVKFFAVAGMLLSIILGIILCLSNILIGIIVCALGFLLSWVGAWLMYGYGEMVQRLINIDKKLGAGNKQSTHTFDPAKFKTIDSAKDKETLYQSALEQINKKTIQFCLQFLKTNPRLQKRGRIVKTNRKPALICVYVQPKAAE